MERTDCPSEASEGANPAGTLFWTSSLWNCERINFCCLSHPVGGTLLGQPWEMDTHAILGIPSSRTPSG